MPEIKIIDGIKKEEGLTGKKACIYGRISKAEKQLIKNDILTTRENQLRTCSYFVQSRGIIFTGLFYFDKDKSGKGDAIEKRKEFLKMIEDAKQNKFDLIIVKDWSRFMRDVGMQEYYIKELEKLGIKVITTDGTTQVIVRQMLAMMNELYIVLNQQNMIDLHDRRIKEGLPNSKAPFGYKNIKHKGWKIVEKEAEIIRKIFNELSNNKNLKDLSREINMSKLKIMRIIRNKCYLGFYPYKKAYYHSGLKIIDEALFDKVNSKYPLKKYKQ